MSRIITHWITAAAVIAASATAAAGAAGCTSAASDEDTCRRSQEHLASCMGVDPSELPPAAACNPDSAQELLELSCEELERADDTNLLCSLGVRSHCEHPPLLAPPSGRPAALPIVLIHGFAASASEHSFAPNVLAGLRGDGHAVYTVTVNPFGTVAERASQLLEQVESIVAESGSDRVHLVGHSMGGLDARWLACDGGLGRADLVATISTIATPHHGSPIADAVVSVKPPEGLLEWVGSLGLAAEGDFDLPSIADLTTDAAAARNAVCPDPPDVTILSYAGVASLSQITFAEAEERDMCGISLRHPGSAARVTPTFQGGAPLVTRLPSDAVVAVNSATWGPLRASRHMTGGDYDIRVGEANFLGCVPGDHGTVIGREADFLDRKTGYEPATFWRHHALLLAELEAAEP